MCLNGLEIIALWQNRYAAAFEAVLSWCKSNGRGQKHLLFVMIIYHDITLKGYSVIYFPSEMNGTKIWFVDIPNSNFRV